MIPSDHFVRYYNEVFKALEQRGIGELVRYFQYLGDLQKNELADRFRTDRLQACYDYWSTILKEENCVGRLSLAEEIFELRMDRCPSLSKVLDNDASACHFYCDHCMGWVRPAMEAAGLHAVMDIESRTKPHCVLRVYLDERKAKEYEQKAKLPSRPLAEGEQ